MTHRPVRQLAWNRGRFRVLTRLVAVVAALATLLGLVGAFSVHTLRSERDNAGGPLMSAYSTAPGSRAASDDISGTGLALLDSLGKHSERAAAHYAVKHPDALTDLMSAPPAPAEVVGWWAGLDTETKRVLVSAIPGVVGNLGGVPYPVRDVANRLYVADEKARIADDIAAGVGRAEEGRLVAQIEMLTQIEQALVPTAEGGPDAAPRSLIAVDSTWPGTAAVAIGDLGTAEHVSYLVPGMFFTVRGQIVDWTETAQQLFSTQQQVIAAEGTGGSSATIAWIGYETPTLFTVTSLDLARQGADRIEHSVAALRAVRGAEQPTVSLLTHSYGSTAASIALARGTITVDALAIVGSPGVTVSSVSELAVAVGNVFVGKASWDPVVDIAYYGVDPGIESFGAQAMGVAGAVDAATGATLVAAVGHNGYFTPGSESMHNLALIGLGLGSAIAAPGAESVLAEG